MKKILSWSGVFMINLPYRIFSILFYIPCVIIREIFLYIVDFLEIPMQWYSHKVIKTIRKLKKNYQKPKKNLN